jgi:6-phosphogluconolactonase
MASIPRRTFLRNAAAGGLAAAGIGSPGVASALRHRDEIVLYLGTYTRGRSRGIYTGRFDTVSGRVTMNGVVEGVENPSFLALDPSRTHLYAVSEVGEFEGTAGGGVVAFAIERRGGLRALNRQATHGGAPCQLTVDATGRHLLVANYSGGNVTVLPIRSDGSLGPAAQVVQHQGSGADPRHQEGPHAHSVTLDSANRFAAVADLGIDRVMVYRFDAERGRLDPATPAEVRMTAGAGPRHFDFHPDGRRAYVINELNSTITALSYSSETGVFEPGQSISTLPAGDAGSNSCADIHVAPSGRFIYGSNRGHDSIAVFAIAPDTGELVPVQHQSTLGRTPRNFAIDPAGRFLLAANQDSDSLAVFAIDPQTGTLSPVGEPVDVPVPVCVRFA